MAKHDFSSYPDLLKRSCCPVITDMKERMTEVPRAKEVLDNRLEKRSAAGHCFIFARTEELFWDIWDKKAFVLMLLRHDGSFGFPGGFIDPGESVVAGTNRELVEEIALDAGRFGVAEDDFVVAHCVQAHPSFGQLQLNFFAKEVSEEHFNEIEAKALHADEYGLEALGVVRVPLYSDGEDGLPTFLANRFSGNSRNQLLYTLLVKDLLTLDEIKAALETANSIASKKTD